MSKSALKILETAERLFNQNSFTGVGVDLIRDESGCSKTTMYTYYKNKNQLVESVLIARDEKFKRSLFQYIGAEKGKQAIYKMIDWHAIWFQQEDFKGCLFVRAIAESDQTESKIITISKTHKQWIKNLIHQHCTLANHQELSELTYTLIEGLISRFLVEEFDQQIILDHKNLLDQLFSHSNLNEV